MHQYTAQEYFDLLVKTSEKGGFPSTQGTGSYFCCRYRTKDGRCCAIGIVIPDDVYNPDMENSPIDELLEDGLKLEDIGLSNFEPDDIWEIQNVHDMMATFVTTRTYGWDHDNFIFRLRLLSCFRGCEINIL